MSLLFNCCVNSTGELTILMVYKYLGGLVSCFSLCWVFWHSRTNIYIMLLNIGTPAVVFVNIRFVIFLTGFHYIHVRLITSFHGFFKFFHFNSFFERVQFNYYLIFTRVQFDYHLFSTQVQFDHFLCRCNSTIPNYIIGVIIWPEQPTTHTRHYVCIQCAQNDNNTYMSCTAHRSQSCVFTCIL